MGNSDWLEHLLSKVYGEIISIEEKCPGVYHLCAKPNETNVIPQEWYIVEKSASSISNDAKQYGMPVEEHPSLLSFSLDDPYSGGKIITYEIWRYRLRNHLPGEATENIPEFAVHCDEYHPEYFGLYPVPMPTPRGYLVRYRTISNGVYLIETDQGGEVVAICFPYWQTLSEFAQKIGEQTEYDREHGIDQTKGYLFFTRENSCIPFFELWAEHPDWKDSHQFDFSAMMNAIWERFPVYASVYNAMEQGGKNDIASALSDIVHEMDLSVRPEKMISLTPGGETSFLKLP